MTDILTDQIVARHRHDDGRGAEAKPVQDAGHPSATVVLPVPGLPLNDMCRVGKVVARRHLLPDPFDQQQRGDLANPGLHRSQPDQLAIKLLQHRRDIDGLELPPQVDVPTGAAEGFPRPLVISS